MARRLLLGASNKPTSRLSCESDLLEPTDLVRLPNSHLLDELLDSNWERLSDLNELHAPTVLPCRYSHYPSMVTLLCPDGRTYVYKSYTYNRWGFRMLEFGQEQYSQ